MFREFNFDGLIGPTHNYAGLSHGNIASAKNRGLTASPRAAALQGIAKMRFVASLGIGQAVLPPLPRPHLGLLRSLGFSGSPSQMIESAQQVDPALVAIAFSASSMWTANAATVSPSADTQDGRVHFTPANLNTLLHRSIEAEQTAKVLMNLFADSKNFCVHQPLPFGSALSDEGAANHTRLAANHGAQGLEIFTYGRSALSPDKTAPAKFPARQTIEASQTIARRHQLRPEHSVFVQQNPAAIDQGVFHNDVISVGSANLLLAHEMAFVDQPRAIETIRQAYERLNSSPLDVVEVANRDLPIADAISSYLFNSQLLQLPSGKFVMICPTECQEIPSAAGFLNQLVADERNPIERIEYLNLRQSMRNGGGPACLRLRVVLSLEQQSAIPANVFFNTDLDRQLTAWVENHYREELSPNDLRDPQLVDESNRATEELAGILNLPSLRELIEE
ncbi:MAG: N-succinylarginine dihydrolase [Pirellulaceae bacterium]